MGRLWETQSVEAVGFPWVFGKRPGVGAGGRGGQEWRLRPADADAELRHLAIEAAGLREVTGE